VRVVPFVGPSSVGSAANPVDEHPAAQRPLGGGATGFEPLVDAIGRLADAATITPTLTSGRTA
jgi:hypothetical protein